MIKLFSEADDASPFGSPKHNTKIIFIPDSLLLQTISFLDSLLFFISWPGLVELLVMDYFLVQISPRYSAPSSFGSLCLQWRITNEFILSDWSLTLIRLSKD